MRNEDIIAGFVGSPEYFDRHHDDVYNWVFSAYWDILGRQASISESQSMANYLANYPA
jgi:hypothetical protein